ncbi:MAG: hypothetical protein J6Q38_01115 [Clostridia bacterium]|nr:hypothetical protein [Clostridia bacterium]
MTEFKYCGEHIYIVLSQTGSFVSKGLKVFTKDKYNHVSISLDSGLDEMCSFGRYYAYFPFWGGFVKESTKSGSLKRFKNTESLIIKISANEEKINGVRLKINQMFASKRKYRYDMIGVLLAKFGKNKKRKFRYYCSEFVKEILIENDILKREDCPEIMKPMDFLNVSGGEIIYEGSLHAYVKDLKK